MCRVFMISGKAEHGKSTFADMLESSFKKQGKSVMRLSFAGLLKYYAKEHFGYRGRKDKKDRDILQHLGTDIVRAKDQNFWAKAARDWINLVGEHFDVIIIDDWRFKNEYDFLRDFDVTTLRIERLNHVSKLTEEQLKHPSEVDLDDFPFSTIIENTELDLLQESADYIVETELSNELV